MGNHKSGNRQSRNTKKSPEEKSRLYQFRLHPDNADEAWLMERITHYEQRGLPLRRLFAECMAVMEDVELPEHSAEIGSKDFHELKLTVQWIAEQIQNGGLSSNAPRRTKQKAIQVPEAVRNTLDRYLGNGISMDDED